MNIPITQAKILTQDEIEKAQPIHFVENKTIIKPVKGLADCEPVWVEMEIEGDE
jgi:hypothetical protein